MILIDNPSCSKCASLSDQLKSMGYEWESVCYLDGELTSGLVDRIVDHYTGPLLDLVRTSEQAWIDSGIDPDNPDSATLKLLLLEHPIVLQRPIALINGNVIVARPPEVLWDFLAR